MITASLTFELDLTNLLRLGLQQIGICK
uniref:Uncharacterized protein n=1 Tax=Nelumbo nucifera TaxID=4432 RepID=A0A822ZIT4_NELNU|nr:TPA_asm: hypothetical protein HUJ06_002773 [Nelumbo nucifera]